MDAGRQLGSGRTADVFALRSNRVLKLFKRGTDTDVARREADNTRAAEEAGVPVPSVHECTVVNGRPAIVYERITGPTMRSRLASRPWTIRRNARLLAATHFSMHETHPPGLTSFRDRLRRSIRDATELSSDTRQRILSKLESLPEGNALCHGDFHPENVLLADDGPVVIDWHDSGYGHPAADVARTNLVLKYADRQDGWIRRTFRRVFRQRYLDCYRSYGELGESRIREWELPIAAARLAEGVPEGPQLRSFIDARLTKE